MNTDRDKQLIKILQDKEDVINLFRKISSIIAGNLGHNSEKTMLNLGKKLINYKEEKNNANEESGNSEENTG